ncbi:MAG: MarR family transcriptional regulator [Balneolaceae bacterium]|nr:MAG: MarR family transcriptional regulator [Balneolaceae bacterium]
MDELKKYIKLTTGLEPAFQLLGKEALNKLPLFIRKGVHIYKAELAGSEMLFIFPEGKEIPAPKQLHAQIEKIEELFGYNAVLVLQQVEPYMRNQLVQKRVAFVIPNEQIYIPWMFIALDERKRMKLAHVESFYPATQTLLIYHLWKNPLNGLNLKEIAAQLDYTAMTVTRAVRELKAAGICTTRGGRQKIVSFEGTNRELWEKSKQFLKSPVQKEIEYTANDNFGTWTVAGINALAAYTNLDAGFDNSYAVKKENFKKQIQTDIAAEPREATVQLWSYDPAVLAKDGVADPFSVWITLQNHPDERVQIALEEMMEAVL